MKKYLIVFLIIFPLTCLSEPRLRPTNWATPVINTHLKNIYFVDKQIYRSEQPDEDDINDLKILGINEILNLREFHSDKNIFGSTNFDLHHIKMHTSKITENEIALALKYIKGRKGPILIHCWHGSDRTGVVVASYRIIFNHWSKSEAIDEMVNGGFGYHQKIYPELIKLVENLNVANIVQKLNN
jgi:protein tyrosine/serine phosphatase